MNDLSRSAFRNRFTHPRVEQCAIDRLLPYPRNPRTHSDKQIHQIAASIGEFGFTNPVLADQHGQIIAGHGRVAAAKLLGLDTVPVIRVEHLSDDQKRAYVIADNKLALNAGWDPEMLAIELQNLATLTNAFSKRIENHVAAVALYVAHYNFCRVHEALRVTPAMHLGVTDHIWTIGELVDAALDGVFAPSSPKSFGRFTVIKGGAE